MALNPEQKIKLGYEMEKQKAFDSLQRQRVHMENKHKFANFNRYLYMQKKEINEGEDVALARIDEAINEARVERDERLALEMSRMKTNDIGEMRRRQIIRESPELKELETKLKAAYTNKILQQQMEEKRAEKLETKKREAQAFEILQQARIDQKDYQNKIKQNLIMQKHKYKQELQDQIIFLERTKRFQYDEFLREKIFLNEIVQRIYDEDIRQQEIKYCKMLRTKEEIKAFKAAQDEWKAKARQKIEEEDRKIQEYIKEKMELQRKMQSDKAEKEAFKEKICDDMAKKMYAAKRKVQEREQVFLELNEEEQKAAFDKEVKEKMEKDFRARIEVLAVLHQQMAERKEQERKQAEQDEAYKKNLIAKIAEDDRLEQLENEKRRRRMMQNRDDCVQMIKDQRIMKAVAMQEQIKLDENQRLEMEHRRQLIEQERIRILQEHAHNLIGYMPRGVLKEEDLKYLGPEVAGKFYCSTK